MTKPEVKLGPVFCHYYEVHPEGNVSPDHDPHGELRGKNVLVVFGSERDTCDKFDLSLADLHKELEVGRKILYEERNKRPRPYLDNKIITAWNGKLAVYFTFYLGDVEVQHRIDIIINLSSYCTIDIIHAS